MHLAEWQATSLGPALRLFCDCSMAPWHEEREWNRFLQSGIAVILSIRQSSIWVTCCENTLFCTTGSGHIFLSTAYIACRFEGGHHLEDHLRHCLNRGESLGVDWMWWIGVYRLLGAFLLSLRVIMSFFHHLRQAVSTDWQTCFAPVFSVQLCFGAYLPRSKLSNNPCIFKARSWRGIARACLGND